MLFNDALNTFLIRYMVKDHSDSERGNPLPPLYGLLFPISSVGSFSESGYGDNIYTYIPQIKTRSIPVIRAVRIF